MKIHVFVDDNNNVVSTSPATTSPDSGQAVGNGVVLGNAVSAQQGAKITRYELDTERDLSLDLEQLKDASELHQTCAQAIQNGTARKL